MDKYELITILGPTASGKTNLACNLAYKLDTEIISGDSRQIYRGMDIGTGKDLSDYTIDNKAIPYHLIDILNAGDKYNIFEYQHDFHNVFTDIKSRGKLPILCGGSGLYLESVLSGYSLVDVPKNNSLRQQLESKSMPELIAILQSYGELHNTTDIIERRRAIRAIEIEDYKKTNVAQVNEFQPINSLNIGVSIDRDTRRNKISQRLRDRIKEGMIEEVESLIKAGVDPVDLIYYGLEYKYLTLYILGELSKSEMIDKLEIAIHQFAKRQMTWFRGMEKRGLKIHWIDANEDMSSKISQIESLIK